MTSGGDSSIIAFNDHTRLKREKKNTLTWLKYLTEKIIWQKKCKRCLIIEYAFCFTMHKNA